MRNGIVAAIVIAMLGSGAAEAQEVVLSCRQESGNYPGTTHSIKITSTREYMYFDDKFFRVRDVSPTQMGGTGNFLIAAGRLDTTLDVNRVTLAYSFTMQGGDYYYTSVGSCGKAEPQF